ncbi:MAG: PQQ-dependent sugar dehydrogenase [Deltaproteobacteria bacterium]|nr:PQQ-dependent sugar dehydrogenase [Deltaproteobacteria bacterium]
MRLTWVPVCLLAIGCGGKSSAKDDAAVEPPKDAPAADAPPAARCATPVRGTNVKLRPLGASGDLRVVGGAMLVAAPQGDDRLFVIEQRGAIRVVTAAEQLLPDPFLDLSVDAGGPVLAGGEQGLLGLAFHPSYAQNGQFFVYYTRRQAGDATNPTRDVVARCQRSAADPNRADATCTEVLAIPDFASNHNGGMIEFGADGFLYIGTGDGGSANDPNNNAQALTNVPQSNRVALLGKILRIDVDNKAGGKEYAIPADNPFAAGGGEPEIFAFGLRNPWRWSFDRATGDIWIGDVGQGALEELDVMRAGTLKGANFGWRIFEASRCNQAPCPAQAGFTFPLDEKSRTPDGWRSIIGGQVYRGTCYPDLVGTYFYTDHFVTAMHTAVLNADGTLTKAKLPGMFPINLSSIHEDGRGEIYATDISGRVYHLEAGP